MPGYLFVHFTGEHKDGEQVYFSVSRDGLHWKDLNAGKPVLVSQTGACGVRDPYPVRNLLDGNIYIIATDLRIEAGQGWQAAQENGSRDLIIWKSPDFVNWSKEWSYTAGIEGAGCVWAPEAVFDSDRQEYMVFFASKTANTGEKVAKHRIYAAYTRNFVEFSGTFLYMEREMDVIDTTILEHEGKYYRISKDETDKKLLLEEGSRLNGEFKRIKSEYLDNLYGVEGPEGYMLPDRRTWCIIADRFAEGKGYMPMLSEKLSAGIFKTVAECDYDMGLNRKRHGGVLEISDDEYEELVRAYGM